MGDLDGELFLKFALHVLKIISHPFRRSNILRHGDAGRGQVVRGSVCRRRGRDAHGPKCPIDGIGDLGLLFLVRFRERVEHDKKREKQRDKVGVGNEPADMRNTAAMDAGSHAAPSVFGPTCRSRNPANLISSMRGFIPSMMEMTPSRIISRRRCSSRSWIRILPAKGRKKRLATPTP